MRKAKYLILGAGTSGLALAQTLHDQRVLLPEILVFENEEAAGIDISSVIQIDGGGNVA